MPKFFDDSDLVETDRDWIHKVLFPASDVATSSRTVEQQKASFAQFPFENQPVFAQSEAEDAACSPTSQSNSNGHGASADSLTAACTFRDQTGLSKSQVAKQSMASSRDTSTAPETVSNYRSVRPFRKSQNGGGRGGFHYSQQLAYSQPSQQQLVGSPVQYFHPSHPAAQLAGFYQIPQFALAGYVPANYPPPPRMRTPPASPHGSYGAPVFYGAAHQQLRHLQAQNPYIQQPFIHPYMNPVPMVSNHPFPSPANSIQIHSPGPMKEAGFLPAPVSNLVLESDEATFHNTVTLVEEVDPSPEEPPAEKETTAGKEEMQEKEAEISDANNSGTPLAADEPAEGTCIEEELDVAATEDLSVDITFGNFSDLDIRLPRLAENCMEFGVNKVELSEKTQSQPVSPDSMGQSETSGTDIYFDAEEEKSDERTDEDRFEVCPESPKESGKSSVADSTEWSGSGGPKCWASLFRNTKQAAEAVVVNKLLDDDVAADSNQEAIPTTMADPEDQVIVPFEKDPARADVQRFLSSVDLNHRGPGFQLRGLFNRGNWCYVNAVLQALMACPPFFHLLRQFSKHCQRSPTSTPILDALSEFVREFSVDKRFLAKRGSKEVSVGPSLDPQIVYKIAQRLRADSSFKGRQEDAEEFLLALLNGLHEEMVRCTESKESESVANGPNQEENSDEWQQVGPGRKSAITRRTKCSESPISRIFVGQLRYTLLQQGSKETVNLEPFFTFPLEIQDPCIKDVQSAISYFFRKETVKCANRTKTEVDATRRGAIQELPMVLILQLKYFVYTGESVKKLPKAISYDMDLQIPKDNMAPGVRALQSQRSYKLFAVVFHHGEQAVGGHYTADIFHAGQWVEVDDIRVSVISEEDVLKRRDNCVPYVLFYRRCDLMQLTQHFR